MKFKEFNSLLQKHVQAMAKDQQYLFMVDLDKDTVWDTYLNSYPEGTNPIFRKRREHDCSCCRHFIRDLGRVVAIKNREVITIWDFDTKSDEYQPVVNALSDLIKSRPIVDVFIPTTKSIGTKNNIELLDSGGVLEWNHFYTPVPKSLVTYGLSQASTVQGQMRDVRNVFKRSLKEISIEATKTVLELIAQKSLYKGEEWQSVLKQFKKLQEEYSSIDSRSISELYCWETSVRVGPIIGKIRNHSIGVLLTDLSEGTDLDAAVSRYEAIVAPTNYKRPKAIFTKMMIQSAQKTVKELGFEASLGRRFAVLEDITVPNTLFANRSATKIMTGDVFEEMAAEMPDGPKNLSKVEEIDIRTFVEQVLPKATSISALLENKHEKNMVSLIAPKDIGSKTMFKWNNNFSWAYSGNITDSMKERVKSAGGKTDGVLRFSIQWNDDADTPDDLDAHCYEPRGNLIYFSNMRNQNTGGHLDVDITHPHKEVAVENITWPSLRRMEQGRYVFLVHNYASRGGRAGFSAEIEFDGNIYSFEYPRPLRQGQKVNVAEVHFDGKAFTLKGLLKSQHSSKEIWGLSSNKFHPVTVASFSPNYWDKQDEIGHRHLFFFLDKCENPESPNGFFNEFLNQNLMEHKRVFEALGAKMRVDDSSNQLSGLGFSMTKRAQLVVKVTGTFERMLKVNF